MIIKLLIILCSTILVHAGIIGTDYSAATSVSYSTFSSSPAFTKTIEIPSKEKSISQQYVPPELSTIYESTLNSQENKFKSDEGSDRRMLSKPFNTETSKINKFEAISNRDEVSYSAPVYTEALFQSGSIGKKTAASIISTSTLQKSPVYPTIVKSGADDMPIKSPPTYSIGTSPIVYNIKVTPGLSAYASPSIDYAPKLIKSQTPSEDHLKTVTDSETPKSHVIVSGSGASYSW